MTQQPANAMNFMTAFGYLGVAMSIAGAIATITAEVTAPEPISGEDLAADITPVIQALQAVVPKLRIEPELVVACCEAVAVVLNERRKPSPNVKANQIMPERAGSKED